MATRRTYYQILNVNTQATTEEIRRSARSLSEKYHPDRVAHLDEKLRKEYEQRIKAVNEAKQVLCDPVARQKYNRRLRNAFLMAAPKKTQATNVPVITMEVIEDEEEAQLECPDCCENFNVSKQSCQDYVQCPACGKKGELGGIKEEEDTNNIDCPKCRKIMRIPDDLVPGETIIECPYCGTQGTIGE